MDTDTSPEPGDIYETTYTITGLGSYFTGVEDLLNINWQPSVIQQIQSTLSGQGCTLVYAQVDPDNNTAFVQYTPAVPVTSSAFHSKQIWEELAISIIADLIVAGIVAWFVLDVVPDSVGKLVSEATSSPAGAIIVYGGLAIVGLIAAAYFFKEYHSGKQSSQYIPSSASLPKGSEIIEYM
jgi:hypothetical protein